MRAYYTAIAASFVLVACKSPPPPKDDSFEDDQVVVAQDAGAVEEPDAGAEPDVPEPPEQVVDSKPPKTETFVAEPKQPEDMSFQEMALARTIEQTRTPLTLAPVLAGDACGFPKAIHASASEGSGFTVDSCSRVIAAAHAKTYTRVTSRVGVIDASLVELRHDGQPLWSIEEACIELRQDDSACKTDFITKVPYVASFVGPVLSYKIHTAQARSGGPPSSEFTGYVTDVRTGQPAKFDALIDEDSLIDGLKRDSFMRRAVNPVELDKAKTIDEIWKLWRTQDFGYFGGYYFAEWDADNGLVAMRIWFRPDTAGNDPNDLKELGIWVRPKRTWRAAFEDAAAGKSGFLAR